MSEKPVESPAIAAVMDVLGCFVGIVFAVAIVGVVFALRIGIVLNTAEKYQKDMTTSHGHVIGKVKTVESWRIEPVSHKEGSLTITLDYKDRTKITFEDGRSKELLGLPKEPIPTDKEVAVIWAKYDIFLEAVDAEEFRKRNVEKKEK